ncbi:hypothetical protein Q9233_012458 [Columba guinea]|nr:hypothetical protein Q9233_012458 [Columba guinea]
MTMTDTGDLGVGVTKGDDLEVVLLITAIEDRIVPEIDLLEDLGVAEAIRTMIEVGLNFDLTCVYEQARKAEHKPTMFQECMNKDVVLVLAPMEKL